MDLINAVFLVLALYAAYEYIRGVFLAEKHYARARYEKLRQSVKFVSIEQIEYQKRPVFLIFDFENQKKFICQTSFVDEIKNKLSVDFPGKEIYVDFNDAPVALNDFLKDKMYATAKTS